MRPQNPLYATFCFPIPDCLPTTFLFSSGHANDANDKNIVHVLLHSECFTGETIGSMRCDGGEQLDKAIRQISQPIGDFTLHPTRPPLDQLSSLVEGLGHDKVTANILLGHGVDERKHDIAGAILRDLGLGEDANGEAVRLLTNNPDKVEALEKEGLKVVERVQMVPKSLVAHQQQPHDLVTRNGGRYRYSLLSNSPVLAHRAWSGFG